MAAKVDPSCIAIVPVLSVEKTVQVTVRTALGEHAEPAGGAFDQLKAGDMVELTFQNPVGSADNRIMNCAPVMVTTKTVQTTEGPKQRGRPPKQPEAPLSAAEEPAAGDHPPEVPPPEPATRRRPRGEQ